MPTKLYLCPICGKGLKFTSELIRHLNVCKSYLYSKLQPPHEPLQYESHNKVDALGGNWKDKGDLLDETVTTVTTNNIPETSTKDTPRKRLFANEFLSALREE